MQPLSFRRVHPGDARLLLCWRNDQEARRWSRSHDEIGLEDHLRWLNAVLSDPNRVLWLFLSGDEPVASVRYDIEGPSGRSAEVSILVAPHARGHGYGPLALAESQAELRHARPSVKRLVAVVHRGNTASQRLFERAGYVLEGETDACWFRFSLVLT